MPSPSTQYKNLTDLTRWLNEGAIKKALADVPDDGKPATEGARSAENTADLKKTFPGNGVESQEKNPVDGKADNPIPDSGLKQTTTGKMPEVEDAVKIVKGEADKAASADLNTDAGFNAAYAALQKAAAYTQKMLQAEVPVQTQKTASAPQTDEERVKAAADLAVSNQVEDYRKFGSDRGLLTARYLQGFYETLNHLKSAADDGSLTQMLAAQGGGGEGGGEGDPTAAGGGGAPGGEGGQVPPEVAAAMAQAQGGGGEGGPPGAGGGDPSGGQPGTEDLAGAMPEMNVSPEEIMAILAALKGQVGQHPDMPQEAKAAAFQSIDAAHGRVKEAADYMRSGKFQFKPAADGTPERKRREIAKAMIQELRTAGR